MRRGRINIVILGAAAKADLEIGTHEKRRHHKDFEESINSNTWRMQNFVIWRASDLSSIFQIMSCFP